MPQPNIKLYLILSGILALILIVILIIPFSKRQSTLNNQSGSPIPTTVDFAQQPGSSVDNPVKTKDFTGVEEEELPPEIASLSNQKQELRYKTPLSLTTFTIDFNYSEDKFTITLSEPKDNALKEFEEWKKDNYPAIPMDQFIFN